MSQYVQITSETVKHREGFDLQALPSFPQPTTSHPLFVVISGNGFLFCKQLKGR